MIWHHKMVQLSTSMDPNGHWEGLVRQARCCHTQDDLAICLGKEASLKPSKSSSHPKRAKNHGLNHKPWFGLAWLAQFGQTTAELNQTELSQAMTALTPGHYYFILIWTYADHCNHYSNSLHVHCSELLLFSSLMPIVVWLDFLLWWH